MQHQMWVHFWYVGANNLLETTQYQLINSCALDDILSGTERGKWCGQLWEQKWSLQCGREESQCKIARPWCHFSIKCVVTWCMVGDDKISLEDLYLLRQNAVLPDKQLLVFEAAICSKMSITIKWQELHHVLEEMYLHQHQFENLQTWISLVWELYQNHKYLYSNNH